MQRLATGEPILPGIIGYDDTVIPRSRTRSSPATTSSSSASAGREEPHHPRRSSACSTPSCRRSTAARSTTIRSRRAAASAAAAPAEKATRCRSSGSTATTRYGEKLATPDVSMADLIGEVDPIKVAEGRYLADEETIHYGLVPRTNRGIFAINELPDLDREGAGRPLQPDGGEGRPDQRLQDPPAARRRDRRVARTRRTTPAAAASSRR